MPAKTLLIPQIPYPRRHLANLKRLIPLAVEGIKRDGVETGEIDLGKLDAKLHAAYFFLRWVSETNRVIDHLNMVLQDLRALPTNFRVLGGSPWTRYELLVRMFFHEFYRFRELLSTFLGSIAKQGRLTKDELSAVRDAFHRAIETTIELRNALVHQAVTWKGKYHADLSFAAALHATRHTAVHRRTGKPMTPEAALSKACGPTSNALLREGKKAARITRACIRNAVVLMQQRP